RRCPSAPLDDDPGHQAPPRGLQPGSGRHLPLVATLAAMADKITTTPDGTLQVSDEPIIPFIEGDGTGVDIWPAAQKVMDAAAAKHGKKIAWKEVLAGQKAFDETGSWLPDETVETFKEYLIGIKGPLT